MFNMHGRKSNRRTFLISFFVTSSIVFLLLGLLAKERNIIDSSQIPWNKYIRYERNLLTIFTTWNNSSEKITILHNTIKNWKSVCPCLSPIVFTNKVDNVHGFAGKYGWDILPAKTATDEEIPLFKNMLQQAMQMKYSEFYCYANSDILFTPLLIDTLLRVSLFRQEKKVPVLIVGRRTEISVVGMKDSDNFTIVLENGIDKGFIHTDYAVDYFIVSRDFPMKDIAPVVVGRIAYDNYIIMHARAHRVPVIDATYSNPSVHQTSTAGNYEGHLHRNKLYNKDLLEKESEISSTMYEGGRISCTNYMTKYDPLTQDVTLDKKLSKPSKCKNMFESW